MSESATKRVLDASYRPKGYGISPGLQRARAPYRLRNALTGFAIASFAIGVWAYSISAVKQDNFDDVDEEARVLVGSRILGLEDEQKGKQNVELGSKASFNDTTSSSANPLIQHSTSTSPSPNNGVWHASEKSGLLVPVVDKHFPRFLDPKGKTVVWGAPSVDHVGCIRDSTDSERWMK